MRLQAFEGGLNCGMTFSYIDLVIVLPLVWALWKGFNKGFIIEIFSLLALGVGIYGAIHFSDYTADWLRDQFDMQTKFLPAISFAITFLILVVAVHLLGKMVEKAVHFASLKLVNKLFGALFGFLKVGLILSIIIIILSSIDEKMKFLPQDEIKKSLLFEPVYEFGIWLIPAIKDSELYHEASSIDFSIDQINPSSD